MTATVTTTQDDSANSSENFSLLEQSHIQNTKEKLINLLHYNDALKIKQIVNLQPDSNLKSISFETPENESMQDIVVAGGCIASIFNKEAINDYDIFILNSNRKLFNSLIENKTGIWKIRFVNDEEDNSKYFNNPHILMTATNVKNTQSTDNIQYILTDYKSRQELIASFDFLHCTANYVPVENKMYITHNAYESITLKWLVRHNKERPPLEYRVKNLIRRGWVLSNSALDEYYECHFADMLKGLAISRFSKLK